MGGSFNLGSNSKIKDMARIINASIDLTKIDKSKIETMNKNGQPFANGAKYYPIQIVINDEKNQYGQDVAIKEQMSQEDRESGLKAKYLGNGKTVWESRPENKPETPSVNPNPTSDQGGDDLPF